MSVFDDLVQIDDNDQIIFNDWIEWNHFLIPNKPEILRNLMRKLMAFLSHCKKCTALDGCYLLDNNKPDLPLHPHCDCKKINITYDKIKYNAKADLPIIKLTKYVLSDNHSNGKQKLFTSWGYTVDNAEELQKILNSQAIKNYTLGNYKLKKLDDYGQRISIPINIKGNQFYSGWMLEPEGKIRNTTPFGGWIK